MVYIYVVYGCGGCQTMLQEIQLTQKVNLLEQKHSILSMSSLASNRSLETHGAIKA